MKHIKLRRHDLPSIYRPIFYYDGYLLTKKESNIVNLSYFQITDVSIMCGRVLVASYG